jgi:feruloyl esterase
LDGSFALGHPEKLNDFGYRSLQETHDKAIAIIQAFYGTAPKHTYFVGCSDGGREGLILAQRYPTAFDGIYIGAPANYYTHLHLPGLKLGQMISKDPAAILPPAKLPALQAAALKSCDKVDGVADGVVEDPRKCSFDPVVMKCTGAETDSCLTAAQVETVRYVMQGLHNPNTGALIFPGTNPYAAASTGGWGGWDPWISTTPANHAYQIGFGLIVLGNFYYNDSHWDGSKFNFDSDLTAYDASAVAKAADAIDPNLSAFKAHGSKLLMWHGWEDPGISPYNTINYYEAVIRQNATSADGKAIDHAYRNPQYPYQTTKMTPHKDNFASPVYKTAYARALATTQQFARLFLAPGVTHCGPGPGPSSFVDASDQYGELVQALQNWVENGVAPDRVVISKHTKNDPAQPVVRTRPLCAYPKVATYTGSGSTDSADNFVCK